MLEQLYTDGTKFHECVNNHSWVTNSNGELLLSATGIDAESLASDPRIENAIKPKSSTTTIQTHIDLHHNGPLTPVGVAHYLRSQCIPAVYDPVSGKVKVTNGNLSFTDSLDSAIRYYSWTGTAPLPPEVTQEMQILFNDKDIPKKKNYIEDETTRAIDLNEE